MSETQFERMIQDFAVSVMTMCGKTKEHRILKEQLIQAAVGMGFHVRETAACSDRAARIAAWKEAARDSREAIWWLSVLSRGGWLDRIEAERAETVCRQIAARIGTACRRAEKAAPSGRSGRTVGGYLTSRLAIRGFSLRDEAALSGLIEPGLAALLPIPAADGSRVSALLDRWRETGDMLAILHKQREEVVGMIGAVPDAANPGRCRLTFAVRPDCRCRGYATEALGGMLRFRFSGGLTVAAAETPPDNRAAIRVLLHCGFHRDGILRRALPDGRDLAVFSLLREEWEAMEETENRE